MVANVVAGGVDQRGLWGLKDPLWACGGLLAGIDLRAFAGNGEDWVLRRRRNRWILFGILRDYVCRQGERPGKEERKMDSLIHRAQSTPLRFCEFE